MSERRVALPVLASKALASGTHPTIRTSKSSRWRAGVLILVHVLMGIHIVQWLITGLTLTPVEPSESMYTLELGKVNAGFIFFVLAIVSTLVFGRFFCGWGCHIVALQDLCGHWMNKLGVRPRPFRSRVLLWAPLLLALYMFVWPTFRREVLQPATARLTDALVTVLFDGVIPAPGLAAWMRDQPMPASWLLGQTPPFPGLRNALMTEEYWATFAPWYVAIPFIAVCTFGVVYFLGNKGFCTYACPYGGFFGPADRVALGAIKVSDACEGCGHCTAVCTSNVRVHQEVREFGRVVDPGCMKCMDCVSVCPKHALSFGFATPSIFTTRKAGVRAGRRPAYDLTPAGEVLFAIVTFASFWAWRGWLDAVPMLMAAAMALITAFVLWKSVQVLRVPNVRLQSLQLRIRGRTTRWGYVTLAFTAITILACVWAGSVKFARSRADYLDTLVTTPQAVAFAPGYVPDPTEKALAQRALSLLLAGGSQDDAALRPGTRAYGWQLTPSALIRAGWLAAVAGEREHAERAITRAMMRGRARAEVIQGLATLMQLRGAPREEFVGVLERSLAAQPNAQHVRMTLARILAGQDPARARALAEDVFAAGRHAEEAAVVEAADLVARLGDVPAARAALEQAIRQRPLGSQVRSMAATLASAAGEHAEAKQLIEAAQRIEPKNMALVQQGAMQALAAGDLAAASVGLRTVADAQPTAIEPRQMLTQLLLDQGKPQEALVALDEIIRLLPSDAGPLLDKAAILRGLGRASEAEAVEGQARGIGR